MLSAFEKKEALEKKASRTLQVPIINADNKRSDKGEQDPERARYKSMRRLLGECLKNSIDGVCAANVRLAMDGWLRKLIALLQLDDSGRYLCSLLNAGRRLLVTENRAEAEVQHNALVVKGGQSPGLLSIATSDVSAYPNVTPGSHIYINYHRSAKKDFYKGCLRCKRPRFSGRMFLWDMGTFST